MGYSKLEMAKKERASKRHLQAGECRDEQVSTTKESERAKSTHTLENA
jgi:hypothetical protein